VSIVARAPRSHIGAQVDLRVEIDALSTHGLRRPVSRPRGAGVEPSPDVREGDLDGGGEVVEEELPDAFAVGGADDLGLCEAGIGELDE